MISFPYICFLQLLPNQHPNDTARKNKIHSYFISKKKKSLAEVVAKMVALDGLTFNVFETSDELRQCLRARGFNIPKTAKTFQRMVIQFSNDVRRKQKAEINDLISKGERFCTTFDEWTSLRSRRFINLILHGQNSKIWNIDLIRIFGSLTSEKCLSS